MPRSKKYEYLTWLQALKSKWSDYCKVIGFIEGKDGRKYAIPAVKALLLALNNPRVMRFCMGEDGWHQYQKKIRKRDTDFEMRRYRKAHTGENSLEYREWVEKVYRSGLRLQARSVKPDTLKELKSQLQQAKKRIYRYKKTGKVLEEGREAERIRKLESKIKAMKSGVKNGKP